VFELLALKGTVKILRQLQKEQRSMYSDLVKIVGHSTTTTRALNAMMKLGLIQKEVLNEKYRPVMYFLTDKGRKLAEVASQLENL
jgi:DNA-binding HxlR family transcriptional regulator